jgi:hypothetical protein
VTTSRKSYSQSDEQMARQFTERGQFAESVAYLTRSLRTDPQTASPPRTCSRCSRMCI